MKCLTKSKEKIEMPSDKFILAQQYERNHPSFKRDTWCYSVEARRGTTWCSMMQRILLLALYHMLLLMTVRTEGISSIVSLKAK